MSKKSPKEQKPLSKEEVAKFKPIDQAAKLQQVMGFDLSTAYKVGLELDSDNPAVVPTQTSPATKAANVDAIPQTKEKK